MYAPGKTTPTASALETDMVCVERIGERQVLIGRGACIYGSARVRPPRVPEGRLGQALPDGFRLSLTVRRITSGRDLTQGRVTPCQSHFEW